MLSHLLTELVVYMRMSTWIIRGWTCGTRCDGCWFEFLYYVRKEFSSQQGTTLDETDVDMVIGAGIECSEFLHKTLFSGGGIVPMSGSNDGKKTLSRSACVT